MEIIPGHWDPRNLYFIEDPDIDQLELWLPRGSSGGASRAKHKSSVSGASAAGPETADAYCNKKQY